MSYLTPWGGKPMENEVVCTLDNLVIYTEKVTSYAFEMFEKKLSKAEMEGKIPNIRLTIGLKFSEYHYRLNVGEGGGAITVGFKHNSCRSDDGSYTMRIEFNPQKNKVLHREFWSVYNDLFIHHSKKIKQIDLAFDINEQMKNLMVYSISGRQKTYYKSTQYFGAAGKTGRLKVYDKKTELEEQQGVTITDEQKTRIEYTYKFDTPITVQLLSKFVTHMNDEYKIVRFDNTRVTGELKACILAYQNNYVEMKEFTRTTKTKIKKALDDMDRLDLDQVYMSAKEKVIQLITSYFSIA